ncbi:hypothetical protein [Clostridium botulinum]|uniref:hypothetical protein n=1 Tax=Clostridium botulinum TaxID=1491 RepID=UPI003DA21A34
MDDLFKNFIETSIKLGKEILKKDEITENEEKFIVALNDICSFNNNMKELLK